MKILILTMPLGENIGGLLQAHALQKVLEQHGHTVCTVDIDGSDHILRRVRWRIINLILRVLGKTTEIYPTTKAKKVFYKNLYKFKDEQINLSDSCKNHVEVNKFIDNYSPGCIVVGSDQVWRKNAVLGIDSMFLNFDYKATCKLVSYGASLGKAYNSYTDTENLKISKLLSSFSGISVREESGKLWLEEQCEINAEIVLDPVLLAGTETFDKLIHGNHCNRKEPYFVEYILDRSLEIQFMVDFLEKKLGLDRVGIGSKSKIHNCPKNKVKSFGYPSVNEWLSQIKNSDFVFTDSYHGVIFSILYKKPFIVIGNQYRGLTRLYNILDNLDLRDRLIFDYLDIQNILKRDINWNSVNQKVVELRISSEKFLTQSME